MTQAREYLPYGRHCVEEDDIAAVAEVLRGDWLTTGPTVAAFEQAFAAATGARHAISASSGTAALHLAVLAAGVGPGDTVVVPAMTFVATANSVRLAGGDVVFADVDPQTGLIDAKRLAEAAEKCGGRRLRAVMPVHIGGQVADPGGIRSFAEKNGLVVIEDACHALGTTYDGGIRVGACRHCEAAVFSTHPVKTVATGEGGAITTNDDALAERARRLCSHGIVREPSKWVNRKLGFAADGTPNPWYYEAQEVGLNYRASDIHCALGLSQLGKLGRFMAVRRQLAERYDRALVGLHPALQVPPRVARCEQTWHLYQVLIDFSQLGTTRADLMARLRARGIGTQVHYIPVPWQPSYRDQAADQMYPGARRFYERCLSIPLFVGMTEADVDQVVDAVATELGHA